MTHIWYNKLLRFFFIIWLDFNSFQLSYLHMCLSMPLPPPPQKKKKKNTAKLNPLENKCVSSEEETVTQSCFNAGPPLKQHWMMGCEGRPPRDVPVRSPAACHTPSWAWRVYLIFKGQQITLGIECYLWRDNPLRQCDSLHRGENQHRDVAILTEISVRNIS